MVFVHTVFSLSGFLRLRWSFILVASVLPVSPMYVRGHSGHSIWNTGVKWSLKNTRPHLWASGVFSFGYTRMDQMVLINVPIVSAHSMCFEHTCECLGRALHARQANINCRPGWCNALLLLGFRDLERPLFVPTGLQGVLDVGHLLPSTIRAGDHDFCSPHECTHHRPFVLEAEV